MRLVTIVSPADRRPHIGALIDSDQAIVDLTATLLAPLPNPPLMRDWGTMQEHAMFFVCGMEKGRLLHEGDVIELTAAGIGTLRNIIGPHSVAD